MNPEAKTQTLKAKTKTHFRQTAFYTQHMTIKSPLSRRVRTLTWALRCVDAGVPSEMAALLGAVREWKLKPTRSPLPLPAACHCSFPSPPQETLLTFNTC